MADNEIKEKKKGPGRPKEEERTLSEDSSSLKMTKNPTNISIQEVNNSLAGLFKQYFGDFSSSTARGVLDQISLNYNRYNPFLQSERLKALNASPVEYSPTEILEFLKEPQFHEKELRAASSGLSSTQYLYYQILREAADIPLFKYYVIPEDLENSKYNDAFDKEEKYVNEWLQAFDVVNTLKRVALEVKREGKVTYLFRQSVDTDKKKVNYVAWQKLPARFVKLTGIGEHGYIASLDLLMFKQPGFSPDQYPPFIREIWEDLSNNVFNSEIKSNEDLQARLTLYQCDNQSKVSGHFEYTGKTRAKKNQVSKLDLEHFMYWVQLPQELCFTFASDNSQVWAVPDTMGLYTALQELTDYSTLAGLVASTPLTAILTGQAEVIPQAQAGQDQTEISPHTMEAFMNYFDTMCSGNIQSFFAPFKDLKLQSLPNIPNASDIKTKAVQNFIATAGEGGILTATDKPSVAMIKGAQAKAASQCDFVTKQCEAILNMVLNKHNDLKYRWTVRIWGDIYSFDSQVRTLKEMAMSGGSFVLPKLASAFDLTMCDVKAVNKYLEHSKVYEGFKPLLWASQNKKQEEKITQGTNNVGRPPLDDADVENDNTAASKDAGNNVSDVKEFRHSTCILCGNETEDGKLFCEDCIKNYGLEDEEEE